MENFGLTAARSGANRVGQTETKVEKLSRTDRDKSQFCLCPKAGQNRIVSQDCPRGTKSGQSRENVRTDKTIYTTYI